MISSWAALLWSRLRNASRSLRLGHVATLMLVGSVVFIDRAEAQELWSPVVSGTTRSLWSVAFGGGRFVAVGENGTIVTSNDGTTWITRSAGTTAWLVGVAYGNDQFVAVGDKGVVLTSNDGLTWSARSSGTTERLNGIAYGNGMWLAVGENGSAVTSLDGNNWTVVPHTVRGWANALSGWLHGVCFAYGQFVATGERGHIVRMAGTGYFANASVVTPVHLEAVAFARHQFVAVGDGLVLTSRDAATWSGRTGPRGLRALTFFNNTFVAATSDGAIFTSPDSMAWVGRSAPLGRPLTALVASESTVIAVGFDGTILRATAALTAPAIITPPTDITEAEGNTVLFRVTASGTAPLSYQWTYRGRPISGATTDTLAVRAVTPENAGSYAVAVTNALGTTSSLAATLTVIPEFPAVADITDLTVTRPALGSGATALLVQPDGRPVLASKGVVVRLNADGSPDSTFTPAAVPGVQAMTLQPDGKILLGGTNNGVSAFLLRLTATGEIDAGFARPSSLAGATITSFALQPDGKILVANATPRVVRLNADGSIDSSFNAADLTAFGGVTGLPAIKRVALAADGRIVAAAAPATVLPENRAGASRGDVLVARLLSDGALDPTFTPVHTGALEPQLLVATRDGRILLGSEDSSGSFGTGGWKVQRFNADGTDDATFTTRSGGIGKYGGQMRAVLDAKGRVVVVLAFNNISGPLVLRFDADGRVDSTLRAQFGPTLGNPLTAAAPGPDGRVWVARNDDVFRMVERNAPAINAPLPLVETSSPLTVRAGDDVTITPLVAGTGPFDHEWYGHTEVEVGIHETAYAPAAASLTYFTRRNEEVFEAIVKNPAGSLALPPQLIHVPPLAPSFARAPASIAVERGRFAEISFDALGSGPLAYEWFFNGQPIAKGEVSSGNSMNVSVGPPAGALPIYGMTAAQAGDYELVLTNSVGMVRSGKVSVTVAPTSRLVDVATRGMVGAGDRALIAGFAIAGSAPKWVLIRGVGPTLRDFGVPGALADPQLTLYDARGTKLDENDDWVGSEYYYTVANWPATFPLPVRSHDAIISRQLPPGNYTAQLTGAGGSTGIGLVEVYEDIHGTARLANLSSRVVVGAGSEDAISGVVVGGEFPRRVLIRAVGPTLSRFGVSEVLTDPTLTVLDAAGNRLAQSNDWASDPKKAELVSATAAVGAFALPDPSKDAAVALTLAPGSYTVQVRGTGGESGIALIEVYELP